MRRAIRVVSQIAIILAIGGLFSGMMFSAAASAAPSVTVHPGQSIQAAINNASAGETITILPGMYNEYLTVQGTDDLTLWAVPGVKLRPGTPPSNSPCGDPSAPASDDPAICIVGQLDNNGNVIKNLKNPAVENFDIAGFSGIGVFAFGTDGFKANNNSVNANGGEYGVFSNTSTNSKIMNNRTWGASEAGVYVGDSPNANALVSGNQTWANEIGLFFRDSQVATYTSNYSHDNCTGAIFLDTANPGIDAHMTFIHNIVQNNTKACGATADGAPSLSGVGVGLVGAQMSSVEWNIIRGNKPGGPTAFSGGVVAVDAAPFGGAAPRNNTVQHNLILHNSPLDLNFTTVGSSAMSVGHNNLCHSSSTGSGCSN